MQEAQINLEFVPQLVVPDTKYGSNLPTAAADHAPMLEHTGDVPLDMDGKE